MKKLKEINLECPIYYNPADYILEIASDEYGYAACHQMVNLNIINQINWQSTLTNQKMFKLSEMIRINKSSLLYQVYIIFFYLLRSLRRDAFFLYIRFLGSLSIAIMHGFVFQNVGKSHGCYPSLKQLYTIDPTELLADYERQIVDVYANLSTIFLCILNFFFMGLTPIVLFFPYELQTINKQCHNGWHSPGAYFIAKSLVECVVMIPTTYLFTLIWTITTGQIDEVWRFWFIANLFLVIQMFGFAQGIIVGAIYSDSPVRSVYIGANSMLPFLLISGFFLPTHHVSRILYPFTYLSYYRFAFEAMLLVLYGYGRCDLADQSNVVISNTTDIPRWIRLVTFMDTNLTYGIDPNNRRQLGTRILDNFFSRKNSNQRSYILNERELHEQDMYGNLITLSILGGVTMMIAYVVMSSRVRNS